MIDYENRMDIVPCMRQKKTHKKIREDTEIKNFPLYCPKCRQETVVNIKNFIVSVCKENTK